LCLVFVCAESAQSVGDDGGDTETGSAKMPCVLGGNAVEHVQRRLLHERMAL